MVSVEEVSSINEVRRMRNTGVGLEAFPKFQKSKRVVLLEIRRRNAQQVKKSMKREEKPNRMQAIKWHKGWSCISRG